MAESVVSFAVERLGDLLIQECKFLSGVSDEIEEIKVELKRMQCLLKDADKRHDEDESVRNWIAEIKDLVFKMENVLETFVVEIASKREGTSIKNIIRRFSCIIGEGIARHKVGSEIGKIKKEITSLTRSLKTHGIQNVANGGSSSSASHKELLLRAKYPHLIEEDFVGMQKDEKRLVSHLISLHKHDGVITINGMGGQGKTTIATRIYNRLDVRHNFSSFAWVCVTQKCQKKSIWQDILKQLLPEKRKDDIMRMGDIDLAEALYNVQRDKKCLVVLDDIWSTEDWLSLKPAFPNGGKDVGSKLLLTTRKLDIKVGVVHPLGGLDEDEGWMLLQKKTFPGKDDNPEFRVDPKMVKLGREMVKKCGCLPLAISVLGGFLKYKTTLTEWELVSENISPYLRRGEGIKEDYEAVTKVLALSCNDLPLFLKPCFLYLGLFPEDFEIEVEMLCLLWIAEGFVSSDHRVGGDTMMDVAERYLDELTQRSMVQVKLISDGFIFPVTRTFESCRLHDLMREMCMSMGEKEDFLTIMDRRSRLEYNGELVLLPSSCSRRLAVYFDKNIHLKIPSKQHEIILRIGSLLLMGQYSAIEEAPSKIPGINEFKYLRVLNVRGLTFVDYNVLKRISELIHLRHLSFIDCHIKKFPSSISTLRYLQTLDLRVSNNEVIIPNTLGRMKQLTHLFLPRSYRVKGNQKLRLAGLLQLEVLYGFNPTMCNVEDVGKRLKKLRLFRANVEENLEDLPSLITYINAASSCHLRKTILRIESSIFSSEDALSLLQDLFGCLALHVLFIMGPIYKIPKPDHHHRFSSSFTNISLWDSELKEDPMEIIEQLPNLRELTLGENAFVGTEMVCSTKGFPQLRTLKLGWLANIEKWRVENGAMPNLEYLAILHCEKLEMLPEGLKFLHGLKELWIRDMPEAFKNRVRTVNGAEGEDFDRVQHVPSIKFTHSGDWGLFI